MAHWLLSPPLAFIIILASGIVMFFVAARFAFRNPKPDEGATKAYACGEEPMHSHIQPDYSNFFHFAFYFTILHVVALFISTAPTDSITSLSVAIIYIIGAVTGMFILLEK